MSLFIEESLLFSSFFLGGGGYVVKQFILSLKYLKGYKSQNSYRGHGRPVDGGSIQSIQPQRSIWSQWSRQSIRVIWSIQSIQN